MSKKPSNQREAREAAKAARQKKQERVQEVKQTLPEVVREFSSMSLREHAKVLRKEGRQATDELTKQSKLQEASALKRAAQAEERNK